MSIRNFYHDAFGFDGTIEDSSEKIVMLFESLGIPMYFGGCVTEEQVASIPCETELSKEDVFSLIASITR